MKFLSVLLLALIVGVTSVSAQKSYPNTVRWNDFSMAIDPAFAANVNIVQVAGDPPENGPGFADAPHTEFTLYNTPERTVATVRVYRTDDFAPYPFLAKQADALKSLVKEHPDLARFTDIDGDQMADPLPFVPMGPHPQTARAHMHYLNGKGMKGIAYLTYSAAAHEPFDGGVFVYSFQAISLDGLTYISASMPVTTSIFPAGGEVIDPATLEATWAQYLHDSMAKLDAAGPDDFQPSLDTFDAMAQTFSIANG